MCKRWNALYASPLLWEFLVLRVPLVRQHSPSWEWVQTWQLVQTRLLGARHLQLSISQPSAEEHGLAAAELEGELLTAHLLFILSHAKTCKLRDLSIWTQYPGERLCHALNGHISRAISRITVLTALSFSSLIVEAGTLQVSAQQVSAATQGPSNQVCVGPQGATCVLAGPFWVVKSEGIQVLCTEVPPAC